MGKRKLNGTNFWQCDWTGFPMKQAYCYWPSWSATGKLFKKGSYCNWESVIAHAAWLADKQAIPQDEYFRIVEYIEQLTGTHVEAAPHYEELMHTKGRMSADDFHAQCVAHKHPIAAVKITPNGEVFEVILQPANGQFNIDSYLHQPFTYHGSPSTFHSMRKKGSKGTDRDLSVWYYPVKDLPHNQHASNLFKMQLYGDVLLVQQSREVAFLPRERFISFTRAQFDEHFTKKRKRQEVQCMSMSGYAEAKEAMQETLNRYEANQSAGAVPPKQMASTQMLAPTSGYSLAKKLKERGVLPPPKPPGAVLAAMASAPQIGDF